MCSKLLTFVLVFVTSGWLGWLTTSQDPLPLTSGLEPISLNNAANLEPLLTFVEEGVIVEDIAYSLDGDLLAYCTNRSLVIWDLEARITRWHLPVSTNHLAFSPASPYIASNLDLWNIATGTDLITLFPPEDFGSWRFEIGDVGFTSTGDQVLATYSNNGVGIVWWDAVTGAVADERNYGISEYNIVSYSQLSADKSLHVFSYTGGSMGYIVALRRVELPENELDVLMNETFFNAEANIGNPLIAVLDIAQNNQAVLLQASAFTNSQPNLIILLDTSGEIINQFSNPDRNILTGAFSPDGSLIILGNNQNGEIYIWDANSGEELAILRGHSEAITTLAFSPDGTLLASGGADGTLRLWGIPAEE
jgi:WD40 repeat protein